MNADPPWNVAIEPRSDVAIAAGHSSFTAADGGSRSRRGKLRARDRRLANDSLHEDEFEVTLRTWFGNFARVLLPGRAFYLWGGYANCSNFPAALKATELYFSQAIIWHKQHPVIGRKDFMGDHEWCFYGWKEGAAHQFFGPNNVPDVWSIKKVNPQSMVHLTEKPVELAVRALQYSSRPGENVLDLFGGSGSTLIAAEQTGRKTFLMELDCLYADVIADRLQRFTGTPAILERTGDSPLAMKPRGEHAVTSRLLQFAIEEFVVPAPQLDLFGVRRPESLDLDGHFPSQSLSQVSVAFVQSGRAKLACLRLVHGFHEHLAGDRGDEVGVIQLLQLFGVLASFLRPREPLAATPKTSFSA